MSASRMWLAMCECVSAWTSCYWQLIITYASADRNNILFHYFYISFRLYIFFLLSLSSNAIVAAHSAHLIRRNAFSSNRHSTSPTCPWPQFMKRKKKLRYKKKWNEMQGFSLFQIVFFSYRWRCCCNEFRLGIQFRAVVHENVISNIDFMCSMMFTDDI